MHFKTRLAVSLQKTAIGTSTISDAKKSAMQTTNTIMWKINSKQITAMILIENINLEPSLGISWVTTMWQLWGKLVIAPCEVNFVQIYQSEYIATESTALKPPSVVNEILRKTKATVCAPGLQQLIDY